jgi:hypothetical protein
MNNNKECDRPLDIKPGWMNVVRRLQSISHTGGLAIVSIVVLVDQDGCPRLWLEPQCKKIEPKKSTEEILQLLSASLESQKNAL